MATPCPVLGPKLGRCSGPKTSQLQPSLLFVATPDHSSNHPAATPAPIGSPHDLGTYGSDHVRSAFRDQPRPCRRVTYPTQRPQRTSHSEILTLEQ